MVLIIEDADGSVALLGDAGTYQLFNQWTEHRIVKALAAFLEAFDP